mgnify:FL=1
MNIFTITRNSVKGRCMLSLKQFFKSLAVLSVALLFAGAATLSAQNVNITVTPAGKNLGQLIPEITKQTGMEFSYDVELLKVRASGQGTLRGSLDDVLDKMLAGTGIKYTITGNRIYLAREDKPAQTASGNTPQRQYRLNGVVKSDDGDALVGVTVVESPYNAVVTGNNGEFSINVSSGSQLTFSYIG